MADGDVRGNGSKGESFEVNTRGCVEILPAGAAAVMTALNVYGRHLLLDSRWVVHPG